MVTVSIIVYGPRLPFRPGRYPQGQDQGEGDGRHQNKHPEGQGIAAGQVVDQSCEKRPQSAAGGTEGNHHPEEAAVGTNAEKFSHNGEDGDEKSATSLRKFWISMYSPSPKSTSPCADLKGWTWYGIKPARLL